jgi:hypothetical protein
MLPIVDPGKLIHRFPVQENAQVVARLGESNLWTAVNWNGSCGVEKAAMMEESPYIPVKFIWIM